MSARKHEYAQDIDLDECVLNYIEHTHRFIRRLPSGELSPLFTKDISGRLIFTPDPEKGIKDYEYTTKSVRLKSKCDSFMPMPWHISDKDFKGRLRLFIEKAPSSLRQDLLSIYSNCEPPMVHVLHCPYSENPMPQESALAIISAIEDKSADADLLVGTWV